MMCPPCSEEKCKLKCSSKVRENKRLKISNTYWSLKSLMFQQEFISRNMMEIRSKYQYKKEGSRCQCNHAFYFVTDGKSIQVCEYFFKSTLDINDQLIRTVTAKLKEGFIKEDLREKHKNHPKVDPIITEGVVNHINKLPRVESHYLCAQTSRVHRRWENPF